MSTSAYEVYRQRQVQTAGPGKLLLLLYDGAIKFAKKGILAIEEGDVEGANRNLQRCQDIISELAASLNRDVGEVAENLAALYDYMYRELVRGNTTKDASIIEPIVDMLAELRETWAQVVEKPAATKSG